MRTIRWHIRKYGSFWGVQVVATEGDECWQVRLDWTGSWQAAVERTDSELCRIGSPTW